MNRIGGIIFSSFWVLFFVSYLFLVWLATPAWSATEQEVQSATTSSTTDSAVSPLAPELREDFLSWGQVTRTVISLLLVCALAVLALRALGPRLLRQRQLPEASSFEILDRMALNSENELLVVKRRNQEYLIALGSQGSRLLAISDAAVSTPLLKMHPDSLVEDEMKSEMRSIVRAVARGQKT